MTAHTAAPRGGNILLFFFFFSLTLTLCFIVFHSFQLWLWLICHSYMISYTSFILLFLLTQIGQKIISKNFPVAEKCGRHAEPMSKSIERHKVAMFTHGSRYAEMIFPPNLWPGLPPAFSIKPHPPTVWGEPNLIKTRRYHAERHSDGSAPHFLWQSDNSVQSFLDLRSHRMLRAASKRQLIAHKDPCVPTVAAKLSPQHGVLVLLLLWKERKGS